MPIGRASLLYCLAAAALSNAAQTGPPTDSFEIRTRMEIDVDGAPNAYGPPGSKTLDSLINARYLERAENEIVGYLLIDGDPKKPVIQGPHDPCPGYYVSTTAFSDRAIKNERDPRKYLDAAKINYVVLGDAARRRGARVGDIVAVFSRLHQRAVYGVIGDSGNPTGAEGSLHLLQDLGYPFHDGRSGSVEGKNIVIRFFPRSNPAHQFFRTQIELNAAAEKLSLNRKFTARPATPKR